MNSVVSSLSCRRGASFSPAGCAAVPDGMTEPDSRPSPGCGRGFRGGGHRRRGAAGRRGERVEGRQPHSVGVDRLHRPYSLSEGGLLRDPEQLRRGRARPRGGRAPEGDGARRRGRRRAGSARLHGVAGLRLFALLVLSQPEDFLIAGQLERVCGSEGRKHARMSEPRSDPLAAVMPCTATRRKGRRPSEADAFFSVDLQMGETKKSTGPKRRGACARERSRLRRSGWSIGSLRPGPRCFMGHCR